ncbi:YciI family protein [Blastopirellula marina]|uniref:Dehydrogenase n=1 Tax=Blastopirellula marina TaxID=124 RepID=A0A2S8GJ51_9BACT|nr:YciI family protein [Blastopirellula marina]PQO44475.1 dehydrogenase [Blastopirellula marina]
MKFVCLGYIDIAKFNSLSDDERNEMIDACMAYDNELRRGGHFAGGGALDLPENGVTLRYQGNDVQVTDGPFAETKEQIGGILLLEARDLNHAIQLMSKHPGVKNGPFEVRPADEAMNLKIAAVAQQFAKDASLKEFALSR